MYDRGSRLRISIKILDCGKGCIVNGPGEAKEADIGIAGGDKCAVLFKKGEILRKIPEENIVPELLKEIELL